MPSEFSINQRDPRLESHPYDPRLASAHGIQTSHLPDFSKKENPIQNYEAPHYQTHTYRNEPETPASLNQKHGSSVTRQMGFNPSATLPAQIHSDHRFQDGQSSLHQINSHSVSNPYPITQAPGTVISQTPQIQTISHKPGFTTSQNFPSHQ